MNVGLLLNIIRGELDDVNAPQRWADAEIAAGIQEGQVKFCKDTRILKDSLTVGEVVASTVIALTGTTGQVDSVKANGVTITSAAVPFNASLIQTAADLAANLTAFMLTAGYIASGNPIYTALSNGDGTVTLSAPSGTGANPNGYSVVVAASGGDLTGTAPALSGGTSICQMYFMPLVHTYALDSRIFIVESMEHDGGRNVLEKRTVSWMNKYVRGWKSWTPATPRYFITDAAPHTLMVWPTPKEAATYDLTVFRKPLQTVWLNGNVNTDLELELDDEFMEAIKYWARRCAYLKDDASTLDPQKATDFETRYMAAAEDTRRKLILAGQY